MEVIAIDTFVHNYAPGGSQFIWTWPTSNWEYLSLTAIPISSNGDVQITNQRATSDASQNRVVAFQLINNSPTNLDIFITLTLPAASVD